MNKFDASSFWAKVNKTETCWLWSGAKLKSGYGNFSSFGKSFRAHRVSFELVNGSIPAGMVICHSCDNPICVNPSHLWMGSQLDNIRDCVSKGRNFTPDTRGEKNGRAILTNEDAKEIIRRYKPWKCSISKLASEFGVCRTLIFNIIKGKAWLHVR